MRADPSPTVLVVDDEPAIRDILKLLLEFDGFSVTVAESGTEAIEQLLTLSPDVIVTDVRMPDMDGVEFLAEVRKLNAVPVIMMTGFTDLTPEQALELGASELIAKPFEHQQVLDAIRRALPGRNNQTT